MEDTEMFKSFCLQCGFTEEDNHLEFKRVIKKTRLYKMYELNILITELKEEIKDTIFDIILKIIGIVK